MIRVATVAPMASHIHVGIGGGIPSTFRVFVASALTRGTLYSPHATIRHFHRLLASITATKPAKSGATAPSIDSASAPNTLTTETAAAVAPPPANSALSV